MKRQLRFRIVPDATVSKVQWVQIEQPTGDLRGADLEADTTPPKPSYPRPS